MKKTLLLTCILITSAVSLHAQLNKNALDSLLTVLEDRNLALGSLTIAQNGTILYQRSIGYAFIDQEQKIHASNRTKYRIGSISKMFTAAMIFQLIEMNKITPDQRLSAYFPALPSAEKITISHLLNHRSGLHDYTKDTGFETWMDQPKTHEELLAIIKDKGVDFEPGTGVDYSNTNYLLLGYILEKIYNLPYAEILKQQIILPTRLKNTYFGQQPDIRNNESLSYKWNEGIWKDVKLTDMSIHGGAGSIISTPDDLIVFIQCLFSGKLVKKSSLEKMKTLTDDYGMGMFGFDHGSNKGYGHNGRIEEFYSSAHYFPGRKLAIAYCTNGVNFPRADVLKAITRSCFNEPVPVPFSKKSHAGLTAFTGKYKSTDLPIEVNFTQENNTLSVETQGQIFKLEEVYTNYFSNTQFGFYFEFFPEENRLFIKETANVYSLKKVN